MKSKPFFSRPGSKSIKTTIPKSVAEALKIEIGKNLIWELEIRENKIIAIMYQR